MQNNTTNLTVLNLGQNRIGDSGATALAQSLSGLTSVQVLNLGENRISDTGVAALAALLSGDT